MSNEEVKESTAPKRSNERPEPVKPDNGLPAGVKVAEPEPVKPKVERPNSSFAQEPVKQTVDVKPISYVEETLLSYVSSMRKANNDQDVDNAQMSLYKLVRNILDTNDRAKFKVEWSALLNFINDNSSDISQVTLRRGINRWPLDTVPHRAYNTLLFVIMQTYPIEKRFSYLNNADVKQINNDIGGLCPEACNNINSYYNI